MCTGKWARYGICIIYWKPSSSINKNFIELTLPSLRPDLTCSLYQQTGLSDSHLFRALGKHYAFASLRP